MPKLQTQGVITEEELKQAERDGKFLIADNVTCSYCDQPVTVDTDPQYLYCPQHFQLALTMYWYPGYPAVPMDAPRYKEMHFFLAQLERNQPLFDRRQPEYLATEKGCPFCDRYMSAVDTRREGERDVSLLNQKMFCPDCGVSFLIEVVERPSIGQNVLRLRFRVDAKHLPQAIDAQVRKPQKASIASTAEDNSDGIATSDRVVTDAVRTPSDRILSDPVRENQDVNQPLNQPLNQPPNQPPNPSQTHASETETDELPNRHKDVEAQIVAFLTDAPQNTAETRQMIHACDCTPESFNQARKRLQKHGKIRKVKRGVYQLINP